MCTIQARYLYPREHTSLNFIFYKSNLSFISLILLVEVLEMLFQQLVAQRFRNQTLLLRENKTF